MREFIRIGQSYLADQSEVNTVNARDLWKVLGGNGDFLSWIKRQLERAKLMEGRDFIKVIEKDESQILKEYFLTLDSGKHIAMMSGTDKDYEVREYFIEVEKRATLENLATINRDTLELNRDTSLTSIKPSIDKDHRESGFNRDGSGVNRDTSRSLSIPKDIFQTHLAEALGGFFESQGYPPASLLKTCLMAIRGMSAEMDAARIKEATSSLCDELEI